MAVEIVIDRYGCMTIDGMPLEEAINELRASLAVSVAGASLEKRKVRLKMSPEKVNQLIALLDWLLEIGKAPAIEPESKIVDRFGGKF